MGISKYNFRNIVKNFNSQTGVSILLIIVFFSLIGFYLSFQPKNEDYSSYGSIDDKLDFKINLFSNSTISLSDYKSQLVLLDFFATWCYPCKLQVPILRSIHNQFPNLVIISVSVEKNDSYSDLATYKTENGPINWLYGKDAGNNSVLPSLTKFNIQGFPTIVLINKNGNIANKHLGLTSETDITAWIKQETVSYVSVVLYGIELNSSLGIILFFLIGLYVALSPCLFPIMPTAIMNILYKENEYHKFSLNSGTQLPAHKSTIFILPLWGGIVTSFGIIIVASSIFSLFLILNYLLLNFVFGSIMIVLGLIMLIPALEAKLNSFDLSNKFLNRFQASKFNNIDLFLLGSVYSIIAFPCAGPAILAMLPLLLGTANPLITIGYLFAFSFGILIPYLFIAKITNVAKSNIIDKIRNSYKYLKISTSILIIIIGLLLAWPYLGGPSILTFT